MLYNSSRVKCKHKFHRREGFGNLAKRHDYRGTRAFVFNHGPFSVSMSVVEVVQWLLYVLTPNMNFMAPHARLTYSG